MMQPQPAAASNTRVRLEFAQTTDPGRDPNKQVNEDSCGYAETRFGHLCVLCDGMGGHHGGREASRTAIKTIFEVVERSPAAAPPAQVLKAAVEEAGRRVYMLGGSPENRARPGSTVVAMLLHDRGIDVAHVGDSRAYVIRQNQIYPLTRDHSMVQGMIDAGMLTEEQAMGHPDSNKITRALGMKPEVEVELRPEPMELFPGDIFISSSDGLTDLALGVDILGCARQSLASGGVQHACNMLVKLANDRGGHDNITVQMARILDVPAKGTLAGVAPARPVETMHMSGASPTLAGQGGGYVPGVVPHAGVAGSAPVRPTPSVTPTPGPIQQPPTADGWNPQAGQPLTETGTEIMRPVPTVRDGAAQGYGPPNGGVQQRVAPTASFEAYRVDAGGPASLPLPPPSYRPGSTQGYDGFPGGARQPAPVGFAPMSPSAAADTRSNLVYLIVGGSVVIALLILALLYALAR